MPAIFWPLGKMPNQWCTIELVPYKYKRGSNELFNIREHIEHTREDKFKEAKAFTPPNYQRLSLMSIH